MVSPASARTRVKPAGTSTRFTQAPTWIFRADQRVPGGHATLGHHRSAEVHGDPRLDAAQHRSARAARRPRLPLATVRGPAGGTLATRRRKRVLGTAIR